MHNSNMKSDIEYPSYKCFRIALVIYENSEKVNLFDFHLLKDMLNWFFCMNNFIVAISRQMKELISKRFCDFTFLPILTVHQKFES